MFPVPQHTEGLLETAGSPFPGRFPPRSNPTRPRRAPFFLLSSIVIPKRRRPLGRFHQEPAQRRQLSRQQRFHSLNAFRFSQRRRAESPRFCALDFFTPRAACEDRKRASSSEDKKTTCLDGGLIARDSPTNRYSFSSYPLSVRPSPGDPAPNDSTIAGPAEREQVDVGTRDAPKSNREVTTPSCPRRRQHFRSPGIPDGIAPPEDGRNPLLVSSGSPPCCTPQSYTRRPANRSH